MSTITNLTKTTWQFNNNITLSDLGNFALDFYVLLEHEIYLFDTLIITTNPEAIGYIYSQQPFIAYTPTDGWLKNDYKTILIINGVDTTNTELIEFLLNNATLKSSDNMSSIVNSNFNISLFPENEIYQRITLNTKGKYLDKDVVVEYNAPPFRGALQGGNISGTLSLNSTNIQFSDTNSSGISIQPAGLLNREAVNLQVSSGILPSRGQIRLSSIVNQQCDGNTQYLTGVTLTAGKQFNITVPNGENDTVTFTFTVDANGNTTIE